MDNPNVIDGVLYCDLIILDTPEENKIKNTINNERQYQENNINIWGDLIVFYPIGVMTGGKRIIHGFDIGTK